MTNHEMYAHVYAGQSGRVVTTREIESEMAAAFPQFNIGSNRPNDHADGNDCPCECAKNRSNHPIFDRLDRGVYKVR